MHSEQKAAEYRGGRLDGTMYEVWNGELPFKQLVALPAGDARIQGTEAEWADLYLLKQDAGGEFYEFQSIVLWTPVHEQRV